MRFEVRLDLADAVKLLDQTLPEEKNTDDTLTKIAENAVNYRAAAWANVLARHQRSTTVASVLRSASCVRRLAALELPNDELDQASDLGR
jgi:hypothetical protein